VGISDVCAVRLEKRFSELLWQWEKGQVVVGNRLGNGGRSVLKAERRGQKEGCCFSRKERGVVSLEEVNQHDT